MDIRFPAIRRQWRRLIAMLGPKAAPTRGNTEPTPSAVPHETDALADALRDLRDEAESARRVKAEFLANINHELRTPLNAVIGFAELLEREVFGPLGDPRYQEYARLIRTSGNHLLRVINEILNVSRSGAGLVNLYLEPVAVDQLLANCRSLLAARAEAAGIDLVISEETMPTIVIFADVARLEHAVLNLIANAIKFSLRGGRVELSARAQGNGVVIVVADTGVGMSDAEIALALEPFRQVDSSLRRRYEGIGLGLPVAKRLVEMHGGTLHIESMPHQGTTVTIVMPKEPPQHVATMRLSE